MTTPDAPTELVRILTDEIPSQRIIDALVDGLSATTVSRNGICAPDHKTRLDAAKTLLLYRLGKPLERSHTIVETRNGDADLLARLSDSPALLENLRRLLAVADAGTPIDV